VYVSETHGQRDHPLISEWSELLATQLSSFRDWFLIHAEMQSAASEEHTTMEE